MSDIRGDPALEQIPVVVTVTALDVSDLAVMLELGAQDYLLKPFHPALVSARVRAAMATKRLADLEKEYERQIRFLAGAVAWIAGGHVDSIELQQLARRGDGCGRLARAVVTTAEAVQQREESFAARSRVFGRACAD